MLHTDADFLTAVAANPADRTLRLVYADWLDEQSQPHGELIRVEEEMRELPVFSDRFWELKPRRNVLRAQVGAEWCGQMRYGTECEPVFRHGIPDGWRERWRLIREFTERWHQVPMPDIGGRQKEIAEAEARLGRTLPPSVREWIAFARDVGPIPDRDREFWMLCEVLAVPCQAAASLQRTRHSDDDRALDSDEGVRFADFTHDDPPVYTYWETLNANHRFEFTPSDTTCADTVSAFAFALVLRFTRGVGGFYADVEQVADLTRDLSHTFPTHVTLRNGEWYEADNIIVGVERVEPWPWRKGNFDVIVQHGESLRREQIPAFLWDYARGNSSARGIFASQ